jgi:curved DNA-binding protein CbpA
MDENIDFSKLEFNLYELLNLPIDCTTEEVKKKFKKIVKKFHPDKISELEEKLYYNISLAHHILSRQDSKNKYNDWLLNSNKSHNSLKNNFNEDLLNIKECFPQNERDAKVDFMVKSKMLADRHGPVCVDTRSLSTIYKEKNTLRKDLPTVPKENYSDMKDFNKKFSEKKVNGAYSTKIVKYERNIVPYQSGTHYYTELKDANNIYIKDTQLEQAFLLMGINENNEDIDANIDTNTKIENYNNDTKILNNKKFTLNDLGI